MAAHSPALRALRAGKELAACQQSPCGVVALRAERTDLPLSTALGTMCIVAAHHAAAEGASVSEAAPPSSSSSSSAANHAQPQEGSLARSAAAWQSSAIAASPPDPAAPEASQLSFRQRQALTLSRLPKGGSFGCARSRRPSVAGEFPRGLRRHQAQRTPHRWSINQTLVPLPPSQRGHLQTTQGLKRRRANSNQKLPQRASRAPSAEWPGKL